MQKFKEDIMQKNLIKEMKIEKLASMFSDFDKKAKKLSNKKESY